MQVLTLEMQQEQRTTPVELTANRVRQAARSQRNTSAFDLGRCSKKHGLNQWQLTATHIGQAQMSRNTVY